MVVVSGLEIVRAVAAILAAENPDPAVAFRAIGWPVVVGVAFMCRMIALAKSGAMQIAITWVICAAFSWAHFESMFPTSTGVVYSLIRPDSLASWCLVFVFGSFFRFLITALYVVATHFHDSNPSS